MRFPPPPSLQPPDLVLHAAAWTNVDGAEDDPQGAAEVNVGGTAHAAELGAPLVAYSTDYVFDGRKGTPYVESDSPSPLSAYGHDEAARRGRGRRARLGGQELVALRPDRSQLRPHDAATRSRARRGRRRRRPARLPDLRRASRGGNPRARRRRHAVRRLARRGRRRLHLGRLRRSDLRGGTVSTAGCGRITTAEFGARAPRPAVSILRSEKGAPELPHWREGLQRLPRRVLEGGGYATTAAPLGAGSETLRCRRSVRAGAWRAAAASRGARRPRPARSGSSRG